MKTIKFLIFGIFLSFISNTNAQDLSENALGLRFGGGDGFGTEISYQRALSENNRLEVDLGWRSSNDYDGFKLAGIYQWVWVLEGNFNWYAGAGGGLGSYSFDLPNDRDDSETFAFLAGQIGIEYNFNEVPLQLSIDTRPELGFGDRFNDFGLDLALGVRYKF